MQVRPSSILFEVMLFLSLSQKAHHTNSTDFSFKVFRPSLSDLGLVLQFYYKSWKQPEYATQFGATKSLGVSHLESQVDSSRPKVSIPENKV